LIATCAIVSASCGDDDAAADAGRGSRGRRVEWAREWIAAYDREVGATCPCLAQLGAFASAEECMRALGSGPTWAECANEAVEASDAGGLLSEEHARCLIDSRAARAGCLERAGCDADAMGVCLSMPNMPADCPPLDADLTLLVLEHCPDLGLLSR
jgi:hypothetical protein